MPTAYCGHCDWQRRADEDSTVDLNRAMIDHYIETGHSPIERCDADEPFDADGAPEALDVVERSRSAGRVDQE